MVSRHLGDAEIMSEEKAETDASVAPPRPVNPDGTTNWSVVFDDPERGVLAVVRAVNSIRQLRAVMENVALLLFKRRHDAETRALFLRGIERIINEHGEDLEFTRADILILLSHERDDRISKAEQYTRNKLLAQSIERRRADVKEGAFARLLGNPVRLAIAVAVLGSVIAVGVLLALRGAETESTAEYANPPAAVRPAPERKAPEPPPAQPQPPPKTLEEEPVRKNEMLAMKPIALSVVLSGQVRRQAYAPLLKLGKGDKIEDLCALAPWLMEAVTLRVHALTEKKEEATDAAMGLIADQVRKELADKSKKPVPQLRLSNTRDLPRQVVNAAHGGCVRVEIEAKP